MTDSEFFQTFQVRSTSETFKIGSRIDPETGERIILWREVLQAYSNAKSVYHGKNLMVFICDKNFKLLEPERIEYRHNVILDLVLEDNHHAVNCMSGDASTQVSVAHIHDSTSKSTVVVPLGESDVQDSSEGMAALSIERSTSNDNSHVTVLAATLVEEKIHQDFNSMNQSYFNAIMSGQENQATKVKELMTQYFEENRALHQENHKIQEELAKKQDEMIQMQKQTLDRLANLQRKVQAVLTQTYELHEYPIPRLFIVLPNLERRKRDAILGIFSSPFKLYFLCECGKHSLADGSTGSPPTIHLAKHKGYDITRPTEFFEKYGPYILTVMEMLKYGMSAAGVIVPNIDSFKIVDGIDTVKSQLESVNSVMQGLVDESISYLKDLQGNTLSDIDGSNHDEFDKIEVLEGAELRQLQSYLTVKDESRTLGNLYRIVTIEGHVKWVCIDHYKVNYREKAMNQLRTVVENSNGYLNEETGEIQINLLRRAQANEFFDAIAKARNTQVLHVKLSIDDLSMSDYKNLADAVTMANVAHLNLTVATNKPPAFDYINRNRRYDPIMNLIFNRRLQSLDISGISIYTRVSNLPNTEVRQLRIIKLGSVIELHDKSMSIITGILDNCPLLAELQVYTMHLRPIVELTLSRSSAVRSAYPSMEECEETLILILQKGNSQSSMDPKAGNMRDRHEFKLKLKTDFSHNDVADEMLDLYSKYDWRIEELNLTPFHINDQTARLWDKLTEICVPSGAVSLKIYSTYPDEILRCFERIVGRVQIVGDITFYLYSTFSDDAEIVTNILKGKAGERITTLNIWNTAGLASISDAGLVGISDAGLVKSSFPMMKSFTLENVDIPEESVGWIVSMVANPQSTSGCSPLIETDQQNIDTTETLGNAGAGRSLEVIKFHNINLQYEDWLRIINYIDFTALKSLSIAGCNVFLKHFEVLATRILTERKRNPLMPLCKLRLLNGCIDGTNCWEERQKDVMTIVEKLPDIDFEVEHWRVIIPGNEVFS